ncbi:hypothetical protein PG990_006983 [Apiospora arundinis]
MVLGGSLMYSDLSVLETRGTVAPNHQPDKVTLARYEKSGNCFSYEGTANRDKELAPCKVYCAKFKGTSNTGYGCLGPGDAAPLLHDDDGKDFRAGKCECDFELAEIITEIVAQGLSQLDSLLCHLLIDTFTTIADVGLMFIPGGGAVKGVATTLKYAKSAFENGMSALNFFDGWVGKVCGHPEWDFSLEGMFMDAVNAPDSMLGSDASIGCVLKTKKSKCKKRQHKPDPKGKEPIHKGKNPQKIEQPPKPAEKPKGKENKNNKKPVPPPKATTMKKETKPTNTPDKPKDPKQAKGQPAKKTFKCKDNP